MGFLGFLLSYLQKLYNYLQLMHNVGATCKKFTEITSHKPRLTRELVSSQFPSRGVLGPGNVAYRADALIEVFRGKDRTSVQDSPLGIVKFTLLLSC